jgi:hypothetical protein
VACPIRAVRRVFGSSKKHKAGTSTQDREKQNEIFHIASLADE